jgi:hypothetical protein
MIVKAKSCSFAFVLLDDFNKVPHFITLQTFQREVYFSTTVHMQILRKNKKVSEFSGREPLYSISVSSIYFKGPGTVAPD